ncbi:hypothetical protein EJ110_NYTH02274 [Nymphaea thermarum]|nr:hypothetical protein EJ110_NYTH02274 [Nymphaea thermarum]
MQISTHTASFDRVIRNLLSRNLTMVLSADAVSALRAIKKSLVDPLGKLKNWGRGDPCKPNWNGIFCFNSTSSDGYLHVREVYVFHLLGLCISCHAFEWQIGNHLTGALPEEIGFLPNLDRIQIDQNMITGPIPTSFANLNNTKHLLLDTNNLSGSLPPELYLLPNLLILYVFFLLLFVVVYTIVSYPLIPT